MLIGEFGYLDVVVRIKYFIFILNDYGVKIEELY